MVICNSTLHWHFIPQPTKIKRFVIWNSGFQVSERERGGAPYYSFVTETSESTVLCIPHLTTCIFLLEKKKTRSYNYSKSSSSSSSSSSISSSISENPPCLQSYAELILICVFRLPVVCLYPP